MEILSYFREKTSPVYNRKFLNVFGTVLLGVAGFIGVYKAYDGFLDAQNQTLRTAWTDQMRAELTGGASLLPDEKYYPELLVVPAGRNLAERLTMRDNHTLVNVRDYPATSYPDGEDTKVLGLISQGTVIRRVILTNGFPKNENENKVGAFLCGQAKGSLIVPVGEGGKKPEPTDVCTIDGTYLQNTK